MSTLTHAVQVTMDDWKRMHCAVLFFPAFIMMKVTHSSAAHWRYPVVIMQG